MIQLIVVLLVEASGLYKGFDYEGRNHYLLHEMIKGGDDFQPRRVENLSTSHYFVRPQNREFNFSNNPTFVMFQMVRLENLLLNKTQEHTSHLLD